VWGANQEREALPVTSDEKGALPVARRRKLVAAALLATVMGNTETASAPRAHCGAAEIQRLPENVSRWADVSKSMRRLPDDLSGGFPPPSPPAE
jgi:hypothetical protein